MERPTLISAADSALKPALLKAIFFHAIIDLDVLILSVILHPSPDDRYTRPIG
jgi:hypothetical protein